MKKCLRSNTSIWDCRNFKKVISKAQSLLSRSSCDGRSWQSYHGLGAAFNKLNQYQRAVDAFKKSLAIKESWQSYQGLGAAFNKLNQYQRAVDAFEKSLSIKKSWQTYMYLGDALNEAGESEKAILAAKSLYASNTNLGHINIDPLMGEKEGVFARRDSIEDLTHALLRNNFSFYPSFYSEDNSIQF